MLAPIPWIKIDGVLPAGQSDGGDQNYGRRAHDHAQGSQRKANFVVAKTVEGKRQISLSTMVCLALASVRAKEGLCVSQQPWVNESYSRQTAVEQFAAAQVASPSIPLGQDWQQLWALDENAC